MRVLCQTAISGKKMFFTKTNSPYVAQHNIFVVGQGCDRPLLELLARRSTTGRLVLIPSPEPTQIPWPTMKPVGTTFLIKVVLEFLSMEVIVTFQGHVRTRTS